MSAGPLSSQPSSRNSAMLFSPSPSMSSAPRLTKWRRRSNFCAPQMRPPVQRTSTSLLGDRFAAADGAMVGEDIGCARLVAGEILDDLRDHVACALDDDAVAGAHAAAANLVAVVGRDVRTHHAAPGDGGEEPDGGEVAGAGCLTVDGFSCRQTG